MKRFFITLSVLSVTLSTHVYAQDPLGKDFLPPPPAPAPAPALAPREARPIPRPAERAEPSPSDLQGLTMTPEMWFYTQEQKRYDDPKQAVRRKAEQRAADRQARLAAMQWYGYSNLRPQASASPWMSTYSPGWAGNSWDPYRHNGVGWGTAVRYVDSYDYRR